MRRLIFLAIPTLLAAADFKIDHVTVAGRDLKTLEANLAAIGLHAVYGGPHSNKTTEMSLVSLPDGSYLELIAIQPNADPKLVDQHEWADYLKGNAGPSAWAVRVDDVGAEAARLKAAGVPVTTPARSGRKRPDGVQLEWEASQVGKETRGTYFPFLIHDFTPREQRVFPQGKPVTADFKGVTRVVIAVLSLDQAVRRFRTAYGFPAPMTLLDKGMGAQIATMGDAPVVLAQPVDGNSWVAERLKTFGEGPCAFILGATTSKYKAAAKTRWPGKDIYWLDARKLGWHLGFEAVK